MSEYWLEHGAEDGFMLTSHPFAQIHELNAGWLWSVYEGDALMDTGGPLLNLTDAQRAAADALRKYEEARVKELDELNTDLTSQLRTALNQRGFYMDRCRELEKRIKQMEETNHE